MTGEDELIRPYVPGNHEWESVWHDKRMRDCEPGSIFVLGFKRAFVHLSLTAIRKDWWCRVASLKNENINAYLGIKQGARSVAIV
jgi:hypothetical protein